jgi:hypothetical protein
MYDFYGYSPYYFNALTYASNLSTAAFVGMALTFSNNAQTRWAAANVFAPVYGFGYGGFGFF